MQTESIQQKQNFIIKALSSPINDFLFFSSGLIVFQILGAFLFPNLGLAQLSIYFSLSILYASVILHTEYQRQTKNVMTSSKAYSILKNKMLTKTSSIMIVFLATNMTFYISKPESSLFWSVMAVVICSTLIAIYFYMLKKSTIDLYKDESQ